MQNRPEPLTDRKLTPWKGFVAVFTAVFTVFVLGSALITYLMPETFGATARVQIPDVKALEMFKADATLQKAAEELELSATYAKRYGDKANLSLEKTLDILRRSHTIKRRWAGDRPVAEIRAYDKDRREAARVANAIAGAGLANLGFVSEAAQEKMILDVAMPERKPARPNWILNLTLGAVVGAFLGLMAGGVGARVALGLGRDLVKPKSTEQP